LLWVVVIVRLPLVVK